MAREVIAQIDIDDRGVVSAIQRSTVAMGTLENGSQRAARTLKSEWDKSGAAFESRMFSMRTAAMALLGSFTLAGAILSLKNLAEEVIKSSQNFNELEAAASRLRATFFALARETYNVSGGIAEATTWLDRFNAVLILVQQVQDSLPSVNTGVIGRALFGMTGIGSMVNAIRQAGELLDKLPGMKGALEQAKTTPATRVPEDLFLGPLRDAPEVIRQASRVAEDEWFTPMSDTWIPDMERIRGETQGWKDDLDTISEETLPIAAENIILGASSLHEMAAAAELAGAALGMAFSGDLNIKRLIGQILSFVALLAWSRVATYTAAAAAATTGLGAALEGGHPGQFAAAAAFWKKVAIVSTFGAAALSASSGGGGGGGFGGGSIRGTGPVVPVQRPSQSITVIVEGNATEDTVDDIIEAIQVRLGDGVNGGRFN